MKTLIIALMVASIALPAGAQQIMDQGITGKDSLAQEMSDALIGKTFDPYSAQFAKLKVNADEVCGLVNLKNQNGGYIGFQPFLFSQGQMFLNQTTPCR